MCGEHSRRYGCQANREVLEVGKLAPINNDVIPATKRPKAEDLLSDVFFDVWQQAGRFEGRAAVTAWLLSIARFKALSARRRRTDAELDETIETTEADCIQVKVLLRTRTRGNVAS
jgi:hypothetical protein